MFKRSSKASKSKSKKYQPKKLAELIRDIRNCKTIAEQRAIVNKEKADIRQSFTVRKPSFQKIPIFLSFGVEEASAYA